VVLRDAAQWADQTIPLLQHTEAVENQATCRV
jgi:hypothetical protein